MRSSPALLADALVADERFAHQRVAGALRGAADADWRRAWIALTGCGRTGSQLALAVARTGGHVVAIDPDIAETRNLASQVGLVPGRAKADTLAEACNAILPGAACSLPVDVRHAGVGELADTQLLVDASDDPALKLFLTQVSNGTGVPLLRVAVDRDGRALGRVRVSHGGGGHACACCGSTPADLAPRERTPCPTGAPGRTAPTLAGLGISMAIAGLALEIAQRLVGGNGAERYWSTEHYLDLEDAGLHAFVTPLSARCPCAHPRWELVRLPLDAATTHLGELFARARAELACADVRLEPFAHRIRPLVHCRACGSRALAPGTRWSSAPACRTCAGPTERPDEGSFAELDERLARELGILDVTCLALGLPARGALVVARAADRPPLRFLLDGEST